MCTLQAQLSSDDWFPLTSVRVVFEFVMLHLKIISLKAWEQHVLSIWTSEACRGFRTPYDGRRHLKKIENKNIKHYFVVTLKYMFSMSA